MKDVQIVYLDLLVYVCRRIAAHSRAAGKPKPGVWRGGQRLREAAGRSEFLLDRRMAIVFVVCHASVEVINNAPTSFCCGCACAAAGVWLVDFPRAYGQLQ